MIELYDMSQQIKFVALFNSNIMYLCTCVQLRDDLMTMLIAGHETTAAVLTWATFELAQRPNILKKAQEEVDRVLGDRKPTLEVHTYTFLNQPLRRE